MDKGIRVQYFIIILFIIILILGTVWFVYDRVIPTITPSESSTEAALIGTYEFQYTYEITSETGEVASNSLNMKLTLCPNGIAYFLTEDGTNLIEHTKGMYQQTENRIIYTRSYSSSGDRFDVLFEPNSIPNEEIFLLENDTLRLNRSYFASHPDLILLLQKENSQP